MVDQVSGRSFPSAPARGRPVFGSFSSWSDLFRSKAGVAADVPRKLKRTGLAALLSPVLLLTAWFALSRSGLFPAEVLVPPQEVAATFWDLIKTGELQKNLSSSLGRLAIGYGIGAGIGLLLGSFMGLSRNAEAYLHPTFQLIRQLPTIALIPAFIMVLGIGETVKIVLVAKATALPVALAAFEGVKEFRASISMSPTSIRSTRSPAFSKSFCRRRSRRFSQACALRSAGPGWSSSGRSF